MTDFSPIPLIPFLTETLTDSFPGARHAHESEPEHPAGLGGSRSNADRPPQAVSRECARPPALLPPSISATHAPAPASAPTRQSHATSPYPTPLDPPQPVPDSSRVRSLAKRTPSSRWRCSARTMITRSVSRFPREKMDEPELSRISVFTFWRSPQGPARPGVNASP